MVVKLVQTVCCICGWVYAQGIRQNKRERRKGNKGEREKRNKELEKERTRERKPENLTEKGSLKAREIERERARVWKRESGEGNHATLLRTPNRNPRGRCLSL